jgi:hypothetical protein
MNRKANQRKALLATPKPATYEVGYCKPPTASQFQPGQSGNPAGRRKGGRNRPSAPALNEERLKSIILEEAYRTVGINDAGGTKFIPMAQAVVRSLAVNAAKGNQRAQRLFTQLLSTTERESRRLHDEWIDAAQTYKIEWDRELARRERLGIAGPEPLPHPDHVVVDIRNGTASVIGPATKEEKAEWDMWVERRAMFQEELRELEAELNDPACTNRDQLVEELADTRKVLAIIARALGEAEI